MVVIFFKMFAVVIPTVVCGCYIKSCLGLLCLQLFVVVLFTAVCVLVAVIIYGTQYNNLDQRFLTQTDKDPSWSYGLCVAALILDIITSILLAINALRKPII